MTVHHSVQMKRIMYKTDKLKVNVTVFTRYFRQKYVILVQKSKLKCKTVITIKANLKRSKVKVIKLPYLTFLVIVLNN